MLTVEEIKLINKILNGEDIDITKIKEKVNLICEQIKISEEAQKKMAEIQDKIVELDKDVEEV